MLRRTVVLAGAVTLFATSLVSAQTSAQTLAQTWPSKPVTIVAPFQAGGGVDLLARRIGAELSDKLGQPFVIDNRAGANGNIGAAAVAKAAPDGYTLLIATPGIAVQNKMVYKTMPFDADRDLVPIVLIAKAPLLVLVNPKLPVTTMGELIAYAKANPGKVNMGTSGVGSQGHITLELINKLAGTLMTHVPYRTSAQGNTDIISGQIEGGINYVTVATSPVREGLMRALAITSKIRSRDLPDIPTLEEVGLRGFESTGWYAVVAPRGTPADVIGKINAIVNAYVASNNGALQLNELGMQAAGGTPEDVIAWIKSETDRWGPIIKAAGITM
jgi:tripartite-type tricarboxylate transporter receptor subunit TctC